MDCFARGRSLVLMLSLALLAACALTPRSEGPPPHAAAPDFSLPSHTGETVALSELLANGPAVVVFYRGFW